MNYMKEVLDIMGIKEGVQYELIDTFQSNTRVRRGKYFISDNYGDELSDSTIGRIVSGKCTIKEVKQYTELDKLMAQHLIDEGYHWIARDIDRSNWGYKTKPIKPNGNRWETESHEGARVTATLFKSILWEDKEPTKLSDIVG